MSATVRWLALGLAALTGTAAVAQTRVALEDAVASIAIEVKKVHEKSPDVQGRTLKLADVAGLGPVGDANFGLQIGRLLKQRLGAVLTDGTAVLTLKISYTFDQGTGRNSALKVVALIAKIVDARDKTLFSLDTEVNETADIDKVLGVTRATPPGEPPPKLQENNKAAADAHTQPAFHDCGEGFVSAKENPALAVRLLSKGSARGAATPVAADNVGGKAFANVPVGQWYEIELRNTGDQDTVARVTVDGLDVISMFGADKDDHGKPVVYAGYGVHKGATHRVPGWFHTAKRGATDNVFAFEVARLGEGEASKLKVLGQAGVVTVQFFPAFPPGSPKARSVGETKKGEGISVDYEVTPREVGRHPVATVTIRYNRPASGSP